jgi:hypothetical protein
MGDFIIYGRVLNRSWLLTIGKVVSVTEDYVEVLGADLGSPWGRFTPPLSKAKRNTKAGKVLFPKRVMVVPESFVPIEVLRLFSEEKG